MLDAIFILVGVAFFGGAIALAVWIDRLEAQVGPGSAR
jgi:hypothetical protein